MTEPAELRIFVLGPFRDHRKGSRESLALLERLVARLCDLGWDASLSGDARSAEIAGADLPPMALTRKLGAASHLAVYVATYRGKEGGWVAELATLQAREPNDARKRVIMLPANYDLSMVLDADHEGIFGDPPLLVSRWSDEYDLLDQIDGFATFYARFGHLPTK